MAEVHDSLMHGRRVVEVGPRSIRNARQREGERTVGADTDRIGVDQTQVGHAAKDDRPRHEGGVTDEHSPSQDQVGRHLRPRIRRKRQREEDGQQEAPGAGSRSPLGLDARDRGDSTHYERGRDRSIIETHPSTPARVPSVG